MAHTYNYPRPMVTVDVVVFSESGEDVEVLVIRRGNPPFQGQLALPGGFVDIDEDLEDAALRELEEETGLKGLCLEQLGAFGRPGRDPRGRNIAVAFVGRVGEKKPEIRAGDDSSETFFVSVSEDLDLAFDHGEILEKALKWLENH